MRFLPNRIELPDRYGDWVLRHRVLILSVIVILAGFSWLVVSRITIQESLLESYVEDPTEFERYCERAELLGGDSDDLIYAATEEGNALFTVEKMNAMRAAARQLEAMPQIARVTCLPDAYWATRPERLSLRQITARRVLQGRIEKGTFDPKRDRLPIRRVWPRSPSAQASVGLPELKNALMRDDQVSGLLLSKDGSAQTMVLQLVSADDLTISDQIRLTSSIEEVLRHHGLGADGVHLAGLTVSQGWMFREVTRAFYVYFPIGLIIIVTVVYSLFRSVSIVLLTAVVGFVATTLGVSAAALIFGRVGILVAAAPLVIFVISTSDVVHLTTAYKLELAAGLSRDEALRKTIREVGGACILTSISTFAGFLSLMAVPVPVTRHVALAIAVGVASALLLALTIVPIVFSFMRPLPITEAGRISRFANQSIEQFVEICRRISLAYARTVVAVCVVLLCVALICVSQMKVEFDFRKRFPEKHPLHQAILFFNEHLEGTATVEIFIQADSPSVLAPESLRAIARLEARLAELPEVTDVYSIARVYRTAHSALSFETSDGLPETLQAANSFMDLFQYVDPKSVASMFNEAQNLTRVSVRLRPSGYFEVSEIAERLDEIARATLPGTMTVDTSGSYPIIGKMARMIAYDQLVGLALCFVMVSLIMAVGIRSLRDAILAQLPNILPAALLMGFLAISLETVDIDMLGIPTVALGIAVDDTIHFLHRYQLQKAKTGDRIVGLNQTFSYTGRAILQTTVILCLGLLPFAMSSFLTVWVLGTYLVFTLLCAVVGDLILLPAMIKTGIIR